MSQSMVSAEHSRALGVALVAQRNGQDGEQGVEEPLPGVQTHPQRLALPSTSVQLISEPKPSVHFPNDMSRCPGAAAGAEMGEFRLRRGGGVEAHKKQPPGTIPLPFGKGQQPGLGLNGFVLAGPWVSNWVFF